MNLTAPLNDRSNALEALGLSENVYTASTLQTPDAHANVILLDNGWIAVVLRGSQSAEDWINDLDVSMVATPRGRIHRGIWMSHIAIMPLIDAALAVLPALPIVGIGHSLGGAQVTLVAQELKDRFPVVRVITFGAPRVGDETFAAGYDLMLKEVTSRWVDARDVVPRVPFAGMGFKHTGHEIFLPSAGGVELDPTEWELLHDDVVGAVEDVKAGKIELLADHHLEHYKARLLAA